MRLIDLTGKRFGSLVVLSRAPNLSYRKRDGYGARQKPAWHVVCDCGNERVVIGEHLRSGHSTSCGCVSKSRLGRDSITHGKCRNRKQTREWQAWSGMKSRCEDKKCANYGGRGISVCARWKNSFENFLHDMGECPPGHTIERVDVNGNYEPSNCKWIPAERQACNKRSSLWVEYRGQRLILKDLAREIGVPYLRLYKQHRIYGKPIDAAVKRSLQLQ